MNQDEEIRAAAGILKAVSYFSGLDEAALNLVAQSAVRRVYNVEQAVLLESQPCDGLFIVESGWLKAVKTGADGNLHVLQTLKSGDVFNATSVFTDAPNPATVIALETSRVWIVPREVLLRLMDEIPALAHQVVKDLAGRVMHLSRMVKDLSLRSVKARLARLLLEQAEGEAVPRRRLATEAEMAARISSTADMVNRALRKMVEEGMINVERHQIQLLDKEGLKDIAQLVE